MEFVILGFLMLKQLTQYDLKSALERKASPFFSASLGSIQAALKKLESNGHIAVNEVTEGKRHKKLYRITEAGRAHFLEWMMSPIAPSRLENDAPTKLFFLGVMKPPERHVIIGAITEQLRTVVSEYEQYESAIQRSAKPPGYEQIALFQMKTLELGTYYYRNMLIWFENLLAQMGENDHVPQPNTEL
ncbi:PadR family transcriptional regulator [Paenibacillus harenae]|uniref:PadR family transcriptional regulator n=1 Tax=Paenibacillus harenae TaxID=306543 RepID=UPI0027D7A6F3|nr:PadR family transcriptional regulator [Paenibacillus harenae]